MKNALIIFLMLGFFAIPEASEAQNKIAQKKQQRQEFKENLTPEQKAELHGKKMTLKLNLTDLQEKQVTKLFLDREKNKPKLNEDKRTMTSETKYALKKESMDHRISMKRDLKEILSPEQFEKWEKGLTERRSHHKKGTKRYKREGR